MSDLNRVFSDIYDNNTWSSLESKSGPGSELDSTIVIRQELPYLIEKLKVISLLDIPCGDFNWMSHVDLLNTKYIGADIVPQLIDTNRKKFKGYNFQVLDITTDKLPSVDMIFTRDILGHFKYENIHKAINNIISSKSKYLLTTSFTKYSYNIDIQDGGWRPINLMIEPFNMKPIYLINEDCAEGNGQYDDKCLLLFQVDKLFYGI